MVTMLGHAHAVGMQFSFLYIPERSQNEIQSASYVKDSGSVVEKLNQIWEQIFCCNICQSEQTEKR